ncbi:MAG: Na+/H+ antiporter NhaA [Sphingopyxis sp.]
MLNNPPSAPPSALRAFLASEASGGIILMVAAALAIIIANSPLSDAYTYLLHLPFGPILSEKLGPMSVHLWINDALMAVFFLLVGLEIKRELTDGRMATWGQRRLPVLAAVAGMAVPALIYMLITRARPDLSSGWAIPAATDIAFAVGVLALLGTRAPTALKLFLVTVAIVDDMGAIVIIAIFYTAKLNLLALAGAAIILGAMALMNRNGVRILSAYMLGFALLWYAVLLSGVHATIAGVLAAMAVPIIKTPGRPDAADSPLHQLEHSLSVPVSFIIVPLFGFANAGINLNGLSADEILSPLPLGIAFGLFLGKQLGIFAAVWLSVKTGFAAKPRGSTWLQIYGVAMLCGIGFTMSLFIGSLAFAMPVLVEQAKVGTLMGSIAAALLGYALLRLAPLHPDHVREEGEQATEMAADGDVASLDDAR